MHLTMPILLCIIAGSLIFFLISLYYIIKFAVRDGMLEYKKRTALRSRGDAHD